MFSEIMQSVKLFGKKFYTCSMIGQKRMATKFSSIKFFVHGWRIFFRNLLFVHMCTRPLTRREARLFFMEWLQFNCPYPASQPTLELNYLKTQTLNLARVARIVFTCMYGEIVTPTSIYGILANGSINLFF